MVCIVFIIMKRNSHDLKEQCVGFGGDLLPEMEYNNVFNYVFISL